MRRWLQMDPEAKFIPVLLLQWKLTAKLWNNTDITVQTDNKLNRFTFHILFSSLFNINQTYIYVTLPNNLMPCPKQRLSPVVIVLSFLSNLHPPCPRFPVGLLLGQMEKMKMPLECTWGLHKPHFNTWESGQLEN